MFFKANFRTRKYVSLTKGYSTNNSFFLKKKKQDKEIIAQIKFVYDLLVNLTVELLPYKLQPIEEEIIFSRVGLGW